MVPVTRALFAAVFAGNLYLSILLSMFVSIFRRLTKKGKPWSLLILSQLVSDNVVAAAGLISLSEMWLFQVHFSNAACVSPALNHGSAFLLYLLGATVVGNQLLLLFNVLDRLQALLLPVRYMIHNRLRRCIHFNALAYTAGLVGIISLHAYYTYYFNFNYVRWYHPWEVVARPTVTWEDRVCLRRRAVEEICRSETPSFWWRHSEIWRPKGHPRLGLCWAPRPVYGNAYTRLFQFVSMLDLVVSVFSVVLIVVYRRRNRNRVGVSTTPTMSKHERTVTIAILAECALVMACSLINVLGLFLASWMSAASAAAVPAVSFFVQITFGSYLSVAMTCSEVRDEVLADPRIAFLPKPRLVSIILFHYTLATLIIVPISVVAYRM